MIHASPLHKITLSGECQSIWIKRDDLLHPVYGGNKWRKLAGVKNFIRDMGVLSQPKDPALSLETMGGVHSNHIYATVGLASDLGISTHITLRESTTLHTPTVLAVQQMGAKISIVSRSEYRSLREARSTANYDAISGTIWLPEGGSGHLAQVGLSTLAQEMSTQLPEGNVLLLLAAGTGTTAMALDKYLPERFTISAYPAGKGFGLREKYLDQSSTRLEWIEETHLYAYGRYRKEIAQFIKDIKRESGVLFDPIYTAPTIVHFHQQRHAYQLDQYDHVVLYHSGGTQALEAYLEQATN